MTSPITHVIQPLLEPNSSHREDDPKHKASQAEDLDAAKTAQLEQQLQAERELHAILLEALASKVKEAAEAQIALSEENLNLKCEKVVLAVTVNFHKKEIVELKEECNQANQEIEAKKEENEALAVQLTQAKSTLIQLEKEVKEAKEKNQKLTGKITHLRNLLQQKKEESLQKSEVIGKLKVKVATLETKCEELQAENSAKEQQIVEKEAQARLAKKRNRSIVLGGLIGHTLISRLGLIRK